MNINEKLYIGGNKLHICEQLVLKTIQIWGNIDEFKADFLEAQISFKDDTINWWWRKHAMHI